MPHNSVKKRDDIVNTKISVIVPTLNAEFELPLLLNKLKEQKTNIDELIVIDSESDDNTVAICREYKEIKLIQIKRSEFDHGKTRDSALRESTGDIVVFLTQDAIPANEDMIGNLVAPFSDDSIAISTGRQIAKQNASRMERLIREFNYPEKGYIRTKADIPNMGIKTFFSSDVCAAYRKSTYLELGGFEFPIKTNEDMLFAAKAINAGYGISYTADALVYHSHNFSLKEQYRRNYVQGYEIEKHKELLCNVSQENEGKKLVKHVSGKLLKGCHLISFVHFGFDCCARYLGSKAGRKAYLKECKG